MVLSCFELESQESIFFVGMILVDSLLLSLELIGSYDQKEDPQAECCFRAKRGGVRPSDVLRFLAKKMFRAPK